MLNKQRWDDEYDSNDEKVPDNWDDSSSDEDKDDEAAAVAVSVVDISINGATGTMKICSIDRPTHWTKSNREFRKIRQLPRVIQDPYNSRIFIEPKIKKTTKKTKGSSGAGSASAGATIRPPVIDKRFDNWQKNMAQKLIDGHHVILDVATSCGKTWAVRNIVAEIILRTDATAIIVTPNYEIMNENVKALLTENRKTFQHTGPTVAGIQTKKLNYRTDKHSPDCQILCMTADNVADFMTAQVNTEFTSKLAFIVLDEVHTEDVNASLWRLSLIPQNVIFVLLSATIGNTDWLRSEILRYRPDHNLSVIQWHVRPIPLQRALFPSTLCLTRDGAKVFDPATLKTFKETNHPIFCPNIIDPTRNDIKILEQILGPDVREKPFDNREQEYSYGQVVVQELKSDPSKISALHAHVDQNILHSTDSSVATAATNDTTATNATIAATATNTAATIAATTTNDTTTTTAATNTATNAATTTTDNSPNVSGTSNNVGVTGTITIPVDVDLSAEKILAMFQTLHSLNMSPALFFNTDYSKLVLIAKQLLAHLRRLEYEDKEVRQQLKDIDRAEKEARRRRDEEDRVKHIKSEKDIQKLAIVSIPCSPDKWRFTRFAEKIPKKTPSWIAELLHYGIGIYTSAMSRWLKDSMFEWFEKRKLAFILCDRSLSLGINLPVRSVILTGDVDKTLFEQMGGRAGRRGYDTEGYVFLATNRMAMQNLLHDAGEIRNIRPMEGLSMIDILRWHKDSSLNDKEAIKSYLQKFSSVEAGTKTDTYQTRLRWLEQNGWFKSKYFNLVIQLEDLHTMLLLHLIRKGKLDTMFLSSLDKSKDFYEVVMPFMTLLCYLWEPRITTETDTYLQPLSPTMEKELGDLSKLFGLNVPFDKKCSDYIIRFMRNGENRSDTRDAIGRFQRRLFDLVSGMSKMTSGSLDETEPMLTLLSKIDERMWAWCQQWSVAV